MNLKATLVKFYLVNAFMTMACNMVHPITPAFLTSLSMPDYMFGLAFAAMAMTNFMFSLFWGKLSDWLGRLRITYISLLGYAVSQFFFMLAYSESTVLFSRILSGVFAGGFIVACMAYLADITEETKRVRYMMYYVAFCSVSASFGYLLGGFIGDVSLRATFIVQIILLICSSFFYYFLLTESVQRNTVMNLRKLVETANPFVFFVEAKKIMSFALFIFLSVVFLTSLATTNYDNALNYYIRQVFNFPPSYNGILKAAMGVIGLVANFTINQWLVRYTDGRRSIISILFVCGGFLFVISHMVGVVPFLIWNILFYAFNTMYLPIQQTLVTEGGSKASNGLLFGVFNSVKSLGMIAGSLIAGFAYEWHHTLPFIIAGAVFLISAGLSVVNYLQYRQLRANQL